MKREARVLRPGLRVSMQTKSAGRYLTMCRFSSQLKVCGRVLIGHHPAVPVAPSSRHPAKKNGCRFSSRLAQFVGNLLGFFVAVLSRHVRHDLRVFLVQLDDDKGVDRFRLLLIRA